MVCGKLVDIDLHGCRYDGLVGLIRAGGADMSEAMVAASAAWEYARYDSDQTIPSFKAASCQQGRGL